MLRTQGKEPAAIGCLERLAIVGSSGMGALCYEPEFKLIKNEGRRYDIDTLALEVKRVLETKDSSDLDELFELGGSSGGARPKVLMHIEGEDWIIKFPSSADKPAAGEQEYHYALCAQECGIEMPEVRLFPSQHTPGYFGAKRFDRKSGGKRIHLVSAAGMLETTHRVPNLDYLTLMKLTQMVTGSMREVKKLFRLMCFNVFAHNRDDHGKNFSFLFDGNVWKFAPAYDLTYSVSIGGEHATTVAGNGKDPGLEDILAAADYASISRAWAKRLAKEIEERTQSLKKYQK
jgi:serine/threonine-protein kinase HipA